MSHTRYLHLMLAQGHSVSVYDSLVPLHAVDNVFGPGKSAVCLVVRGNNMVPLLRPIKCHVASVKLVISDKIRHVLSFFP
jgi:hypothetical protein